MKIIDVRHIEDCFDGSYMYEILFDADIANHVDRNVVGRNFRFVKGA